MTTLKIEGAFETIKSLRGKSEALKEKIQVGLIESGMILKEEIQASIEGQRAEPRSVDTGEFLNSIEVMEETKKVAVSSDVKQAVFMEYGTTNIPERRHFRNSAARVSPIIAEKMKEQVSEAIK